MWESGGKSVDHIVGDVRKRIDCKHTVRLHNAGATGTTRGERAATVATSIATGTASVWVSPSIHSVVDLLALAGGDSLAYCFVPFHHRY